MITWNDPNKVLPSVDTEDKFNKEHNASKLVLVHYMHSIKDRGKSVSDEDFTFGTFYLEHNQWVLNGFKGDFTVLGWSELNKSKF